MRVLKVYTNDIGNGPGVRVSVWCSGCKHKCPECHNPETWDPDQGKDLVCCWDKILEACDNPEIQGLTITGGDPFDPDWNEIGTYDLTRKFKLRFPNKDVWVWTGYLYEQIFPLYLKYIDVLVDGKYIHKLRDVTLPYSGSRNQRVIDVQRSLKEDKVICIDTLKSARVMMI